MNSTKLWLLSGLALILTACPSTTAPAPGGQPMTSVSGTVVEDASTSTTVATKPWTGGAGKVDGVIDTEPLTSHATAVVSTGTLTADGRFSLSLPATVVTSALQPFDSKNVSFTASYDPYTGGMTTCTGTPTFSTQAAKSTSLQVIASGTKSGEIRPATSTSSSTETTTPAGKVTTSDLVSKTGFLVYFDAPVTVKGTITCSGPSLYIDGTVHGAITLDGSFVKGWNKVNVEFNQHGVLTESSSAASIDLTLNITLKTGSLPTETWVLMGPVPVSQGLQLPQNPLSR